MRTSEFERVNYYFSVKRKLLKPFVSSTIWHYHNSCEIIYPLEGEARYFNNGQDYILKPGNILFINSFEIHKSIESVDRFERFLITYKNTFIESSSFLNSPDIFSILDKKYFGTRMIQVPPKLREKLTSIVQKIYENSSDYGEYALAYQKSLFTLFLIYIANYLLHNTHMSDGEYSNLNLERSKDWQRIESICKYIDENLERALSLDDVAEYFNISKSYLCRIFKNYTGLSPVKYINQIKIREAEMLIEKGNYSITEIAKMTGYNSLTHFGRVFKQVTGMAPGIYKKTLRSKTLY